MHRRHHLRIWDSVHRSTSLICTVFMLLLCATGLPLIFHKEIEGGLELNREAVREYSRPAGLDAVIAAACARYPGKRPLFASQDADDDSTWYVTLATTPRGEDLVQVAVDARNAAVLAEPQIGHQGLMGLMFSLHVDLFAGLPGKLFLGVMGLLLLLSIVSGVMLYAPFMRKAAFGHLRHKRGRQVVWLDAHSFIGIVTLVWALVVGSTGVINTCADLILNYWQTGELPHLSAAEVATPGQGSSEISLEPLQRALDAVREREPAMKMAFVAFPGTRFSSEHHYAFYLRGNSPVTARLVKPVWVGVDSGSVSDSSHLPWYIAALLLSEPLHFGDFGGLPLKIIWAVLDLATIVVLVSGLYLWFARRAAPREPRRTAGALPS